MPTLHQTFALKEDGGVLEKAGVVDYCTGPVAPGVFVVVRTEDPYVHHEMTYLQMGDGPYFALTGHYHLASIEAPLTVYEIALDHRPSLVAEHWTAEVGAVSKRPLAAGEKIDGVGGMMVRRIFSSTTRAGLRPRQRRTRSACGAHPRHDVPVDHLVTYGVVELGGGSKIVQLRRMKQDAMAEAGCRPSTTWRPSCAAEMQESVTPGPASTRSRDRTLRSPGVRPLPLRSRAPRS